MRRTATHLFQLGRAVRNDQHEAITGLRSEEWPEMPTYMSLNGSAAGDSFNDDACRRSDSRF